MPELNCSFMDYSFMGKNRSSFSSVKKRLPLPQRKFILLFLLISAILYFTFIADTASAATYYLDAVNGNDGSDGSSTAPWKTLAKAQSVVTSGDIVKLHTGNYGEYFEYPVVSRTNWITYMADTGQTPVFTKITIAKSAPPVDNAYLKFDGINVQHPVYTPVDDGYWHVDDEGAPGYLVYVKYSNYCQFLNGHYLGSNKYISKGVRFDGGSNITIQRCEVSTITGGILSSGGSNINIKNSYIHNMSLGSGISVEGLTAQTILIENNHVAYQRKDVNDAYYPHNEEPSQVHIGSGIAIRTLYTTIRKNIVHGGFAQGLKFYPGTTYHNMIVENNLFYDTGPIDMVLIDGAAIIRNNTSIGNIQDERVDTYNRIVGRYGTNTLNIGFADGFDGTGVEIYNNICMSQYNLPSPTDTNLHFAEDYNIYWREFSTGTGVKGAHSKICVWLTSPGTGLHGYYDYFEATGFSANTAEYTYQNPPQAFFVDPDYRTAPVAGAYKPQYGQYLIHDYHLAAGSPGINFGDPANQPSDSLGTIGPDGFIKDDGPARDATHHSAGCYEYTAGVQDYSLSITAVYGSVTKTPNKVSYSAGESVTLQATPSAGYSFVNWAGDVTDINSSVTIVMNSNKSVTAHFAINTYLLNVTAPNGSVTKSPNKNSYNSGEVVTLTATPDTGYHFSNWSGDASGTSSSTTIVMNGNKSVTANFALNTFTLSVSSIHGSVTKIPSKTFYNYGEQVTLNATPVTGYHFAKWSSDVSGTDNPTTITMNGDKTVAANFEINTYNLQTNSVFGTITKTPDKLQYNYGETVTLQAAPTAGHTFTGWSGDASGNLNPLTLTITSSKSVTANFIYNLVDHNAPYISKSNSYPQPNAIQAPLNSIIFISLVDEGQGIDGNSVSISVNGTLVYTGNVYSYRTTIGSCRRIGTIANFIYVFQTYQSFSYDQTISVSVTASDLAGNTMNDSYSFKTEMLSFGKNVKVNSGSNSFSDGHPSTVSDSSGNIYSCWHEGAAGSRDIYFAKLTNGTAGFGSSIKLTTDPCDQCNPVIARDSSNKLYIAWQDYRRGNWDIYVTTSSDAVTWSPAVRITDSNYNQTNPAIAVDRTDKVYVAWQEDQDGNQDIFAAASTNAFLTETAVQVTSNTFDQTEPAIVTDAANIAYIFWTDSRNGSKDIFAASSNNGWVNIPIVTGAGDQSEPAVAAEQTNQTLHLLWVDNSSGNKNIYYAPCSNGLHSLSGINIVDDTTGADQDEPSIIVKGDTGTNLRVFACWQDKRNTDADLYFAQIGFGSATNIFVGDDGTRAAQAAPAIGIDSSGYPYILWVDSRNTSPDIFFAGCTYTLGNPILAANVPAGSDVMIGTSPSAISSLNDISVMIPAGSYSCDVNLTVAKVENPPNLNTSFLSSQYEFGPSGIIFDKPITITIPYVVSDSSLATAYWYDTLTETSSQEGITNLEDIAVSDNLHAIRFKTTHFTTYFVGAAGSESGGGGGGCSLAHPGQKGNIIEYVLPFLMLLIAIAFINRQDRRIQKRLNREYRG
jgi:hypothetical protein